MRVEVRPSGTGSRNQKYSKALSTMQQWNWGVWTVNVKQTKRAAAEISTTGHSSWKPLDRNCCCRCRKTSAQSDFAENSFTEKNAHRRTVNRLSLYVAEELFLRPTTGIFDTVIEIAADKQTDTDTGTVKTLMYAFSCFCCCLKVIVVLECCCGQTLKRSC